MTVPTTNDIENEIRAFEEWAGRRKSKGYASKAAKTVHRVLRIIGTVDPTADKIENWFEEFRTTKRTRRGDIIPGAMPKNGTVGVVGSHIILYARFREATGRANGFAEFIREVLLQYRYDDSASRDPLTSEERRGLNDAALAAGDERFALYMRLLYELAARARAILALDWSHINPGRRSVHLPWEKEARNTTGFISERLVADLLAFRAKGPKVGPIFRNDDVSRNAAFMTTERLNYWTARRLFAEYAAAAGIRRAVGLHQFKSARATDLVRAGADPMTIAQVTRTTINTIVKRYFKPSEAERLAALDRLNAGYVEVA